MNKNTWIIGFTLFAIFLAQVTLYFQHNLDSKVVILLAACGTAWRCGRRT